MEIEDFHSQSVPDARSTQPYALIMLFGSGFDRFWMSVDVFGAQKTSFRRRPRIDTPPVDPRKSAEGRIRPHDLGAHPILSRALLTTLLSRAVEIFWILWYIPMKVMRL